MLLNNTFLKNYADKYKKLFKCNRVFHCLFVIAKIISLGSLTPKFIQVDITEKVNEEMLFKDACCNQLIFN